MPVLWVGISRVDGMSLPDELDDRKAQRQKIAALFKSRPLEDITADELKVITPHYQQRISECRRLEQMTIRNIRVEYVALDGSKKRLDGSYRYENFERLGRDAGEFIERGWKQDGPFTEEFRLTSK